MISVVLGRKGCGKTTLIKKRLASVPRLLIFDTLAEYNDCGKVFYTPTAFVDFVQSRNDRYFKAIYAPIQSEDLQTDLGYFLRCGWIASDCTLVIDEIDQVSSPTSVPYELARMIRYGRHRGLNLIAASRRAAEVPRLLTSQADELVSFNQTEPNDIKYVEAYAGREFAERTMKLPRFQFATFKPFTNDGDIQLDTGPPVEDNTEGSGG